MKSAWPLGVERRVRNDLVNTKVLWWVLANLKRSFICYIIDIIHMVLNRILIMCANITGCNLHLSLREVLFVLAFGLLTCKPFFFSIHYLHPVFYWHSLLKMGWFYINWCYLPSIYADVVFKDYGLFYEQ